MDMVNEKDFIQFLTIKKGLSKNSIRLCRIRLGILNCWLQEKGKTLCKESVEEFLFYLREVRRLNNNSLNTYVFVLRHVKDYLENRGIDSDFLTDLQSFKKVKPVITILTPEEIDRLLNTTVTYGVGRRAFDPEVTRILNLNYGLLTHFLAVTGARFNEAVNLTKKHLDTTLGVATLTETKNGEYRRVFIGEPLLSRLDELIHNKQDFDLVFTNKVGRKIHPQDYELYLKRLKEASGITKRIHPHIFRHSLATQLLMEGVDVTLVAQILGHKDIQTTFSNYVHLADKTIRRAQFRHPLLRKGLTTDEILNYVKEAIVGAGVNDDRFEVSITTTNKGIQFSMQCKV
jgi:integrase/recombinase XerD